MKTMHNMKDNKNTMSNKRKADQPSTPAAAQSTDLDTLFNTSAAPETSAERTAAAIDAGADPFSTSGYIAPSDALDAAFSAAVDAPSTDQPAQPGGMDFSAASAALARKRIEDDAAKHSGVVQPSDNTPIDIETGLPAAAPFFMDLSKDDVFELIPAGTRVVIVCTAADGVISSGGNPMLNLRVKIERIVSAADMQKAASFRNRSIKDRLMFIPENPITGSKGTIWRARLVFKAFGVEWKGRAFTSQKDFMDWLADRAQAFIGNVAEGVIGIDDGTSNGTKAKQINVETGEYYPDKNTIAQYFVYAPPAARQGNNDTGNGDLPF